MTDSPSAADRKEPVIEDVEFDDDRIHPAPTR
jgi:hypothetical protein